jgi:hypothetical protein
MRALVGLEYPASRAVRDAIRRHYRRSGGGPFPVEKRGEVAQVEMGEEFDAPEDLVEGWLRHGLVEEARAQPTAGARQAAPLREGGQEAG